MAERVLADTNLFLRYLTNDLPDQADAVDALLADAEAGRLVLVASPLVVAEIVWALESFYGLDRESIRDKVLAILNTDGVEVAQAGLVLQACTWYVEARVDYADAWNAAWALAEGIDTVLSFDRCHFNRLDGVTVRVPAPPTR
jgi:predicted nucleic-acid-binding protein